MIRILIGFLLIFFLSCSNKPNIPKDILPQKEMQSVLWDIIRADVMVNYTVSRDTSINRFEKNVELYQQIFKIHGITKNQFKQSIDYYRLHPALMQTVLDSVYSKASRAASDTARKAK